MPSAEAVARYFLHLAGVPPEASPLTQMKLHKLLYYAQGWCLATRNRPLFEGRFQAWVHGPVVSDLYGTFSQHDDGPVPIGEAAVDPSLSAEDRAIIESVWLGYGKYEAWRLREMTHGEPPWRDARGALPDDAPSRAPITDAAIAVYFRSLHEARCRKAGLEPDFIRASIAEARAGETVTLDELKSAIAGAAPARPPARARGGAPG